MKKTLTIILVCIFMAGAMTPVYASGSLPELSLEIVTDSQQQLLESVELMITISAQTPDFLGFSLGRNQVVGSRLRVYRSETHFDRGYFSESDIHYYPVFADGVFVSLIVVFEDPENPSVNPNIVFGVGSNWAGVFQSFLDRNDTVVLFYDSNRLGLL